MLTDEFIECYVIVKGKMANKIPLSNDKERLMLKLIQQWNSTK